MLAEIATFLILGKPLIFYLGIISLLLLLSTASIGYMNLHGINKIPLRWHFRLAKTTVTVAIIHGILALALRF